MGKTIWKTIIATVLAIIIFLACLFAVMVCFSPKTLGSFFGNLGMQKASLHYYESSFDKDKNYEDLYFYVVAKIDAKEDCVKAKKYITEFVNYEKFNTLCSEIDSSFSQNVISTKQFVFNKLASSIFFADGVEDFNIKAKDIVSIIGYTKYNPFNYLLATYLTDLSAEQKTEVKNCILEIYDNLPTAEKSFADSDLTIIG